MILCVNDIVTMYLCLNGKRYININIDNIYIFILLFFGARFVGYFGGPCRTRTRKS